MVSPAEKPPSIFVFTVKATAPDDSPRYRKGHRYDLMVFVHEPRLGEATHICQHSLERAGWSATNVRSVVQMDHRLRLGRLRKLQMGDAVDAAVKYGSAIVVMDGSKV